MNEHKLFDRIQSWNSLYKQIPLPPAQSEFAEQIRQKVDIEWDNGVLKNASELEVIKEIKGTEIEENLTKTILLAKTNDRNKLGEIRNLLLQVQKFMYKNGLT